MYESIVASSSLVSLIPADRWVGRNSIDPEVPDKPFAVIGGFNRIGSSEAGRLVVRQFEIWVHDEPGSYVFIDQVIRELNAHFANLVHFQGETYLLAQVDFVGESDDLQDDAMRTATRSVTYQGVGRSRVA